MELQYFGANCIKLSTKKATIIADDTLSQLKLKSITKPTDISLRTNSTVPLHTSHFTADMPGEYEISGVVIEAIAVRGFKDEPDTQDAVIFKLTADDIRVAILGHVHPSLTDEQIEELGVVDIMLVPVGGNGLTLEPEDALKLIRKIEPKVVIPTHYADDSLHYLTAQKTLQEATKALSMEPVEEVAKFRPKLNELSDSTKLIVLERS